LESLEGIGSILSMNNDFLGSVEGGVKKQKKKKGDTLWDSLQGTVKKEEKKEEIMNNLK
jgi:hypothetical protein